MILTSQDVIVFSILILFVLVRSVKNLCNEFRHQICHTMAELCHWIHDLGPYYPVQHNSQPQCQLSFLTAIYKVTLHKSIFFSTFHCVPCNGDLVCGFYNCGTDVLLYQNANFCKPLLKVTLGHLSMKRLPSYPNINCVL